MPHWPGRRERAEPQHRLGPPDRSQSVFAGSQALLAGAPAAHHDAAFAFDRLLEQTSLRTHCGCGRREEARGEEVGDLAVEGGGSGGVSGAECRDVAQRVGGRAEGGERGRHSLCKSASLYLAKVVVCRTCIRQPCVCPRTVSHSPATTLS
eukprot:235199-Prymnesium_polylepis.2